MLAYLGVFFFAYFFSAYRVRLARTLGRFFPRFFCLQSMHLLAYLNVRACIVACVHCKTTPHSKFNPISNLSSFSHAEPKPLILNQEDGGSSLGFALSLERMVPRLEAALASIPPS
jgi:hypothetical protein